MGDERLVQISVEEFIPIDQVGTMLAASENLFRLFKDERNDAAVNLKRSMVWMVKYIAPTSEFWDWPVVEVQIRERVELRVRFIGHGWVVALVQHLTDESRLDLCKVEEDLVEIMETITGHIEVEAVARLKSTPWTSSDIRRVAGYLNKQGCNVRSNGGARRLAVDDIQLFLDSAELMVVPRISRAIDMRARTIFGHIKRWANGRDRYEGADWCSYKRRRLTVVVRTAPPGRESEPLDNDDRKFLDLYPDLHALRDPGSFDLVDYIPDGATDVRRLGSLAFPRYGYHLGVIHPRAILRVVDGTPSSELPILLDYISYIWVSHYTRIWRYLDFEEQFAYASDIRRVTELDDHALAGYSRRAIRVEELRSRIELMNRIDEGEVSAYVPPHSRYKFVAGGGTADSTVSLLRSALIPSTVTKLTTDPLREAPTILEHASSELMRSYSVFVQSASLRMQRALQILQVLFIVAAVGQVLSIIPVADALDVGLSTQLIRAHVTPSWIEFKNNVPWLSRIDVSLLGVRGVVLVVASAATLLVLRRQRVVRLLKSRLE